MSELLTSKNDLARKLARGIFATGDNPPELGGRTQRLQFMGGTYPDDEREMGGLSESALVGVLQRLLTQSPDETTAEPPLAEMSDKGAERLADYVGAFQTLKQKTPKELVDLVLEHVIDLKPFHELLVEELCSRVYPGWENDDPPGTVKIGFDCYRCADKKMVVHNRLTGHLVPCPECNSEKTGEKPSAPSVAGEMQTEPSASLYSEGSGPAAVGADLAKCEHGIPRKYCTAVHLDPYTPKERKAPARGRSAFDLTAPPLWGEQPEDGPDDENARRMP